jgi:hypothetical protein
MKTREILGKEVMNWGNKSGSEEVGLDAGSITIHTPLSNSEFFSLTKGR